jgi:hypothetical protein
LSVPDRMLGGMAAVTVADYLAILKEACVVGFETALRETGTVPDPQIHMLIDGLDQPYVGSVRCRPHYRGADAAEAIATLGTAAAATMATRVLVVWEEVDLQLSLTGEATSSNAFACLTASVYGDGHELHWYPFKVALEPPAPGSGSPPGIAVSYGQPARANYDRLPAAITSLLHQWRSNRSGLRVREVFLHLAELGYAFRLVER